jgi:hypothetical protein
MQKRYPINTALMKGKIVTPAKIIPKTIGKA